MPKGGLCPVSAFPFVKSVTSSDLKRKRNRFLKRVFNRWIRWVWPIRRQFNQSEDDKQPP